MPVMEGKCALFKTFADVDAFPLCIRSHDVNEIVRTVELLAGSFGGVNLEDISAPRCFEIERRLKEVCDIPVFHDDQHGTAVVTCAALINACKLTGRELGSVKAVFSGAGAAGISIARLMRRMGRVELCAPTGRAAKRMSELTGMEGRMTNQLSGGQQQRVSIGRAIVKNPDILLCDEPTGALDYATSKEILQLIENVNKKYGNTVIMVTHNEAIRNMADHVIKLRDGTVRSNESNSRRIPAAELEW